MDLQRLASSAACGLQRLAWILAAVGQQTSLAPQEPRAAVEAVAGAASSWPAVQPLRWSTVPPLLALARRSVAWLMPLSSAAYVQVGQERVRQALTPEAAASTVPLL